MKAEENRKQHFIPQCYLRNFSSNNKNIFIYDKEKSKSFRNTVENVAYIDYFYELPKQFIENIEDIPNGTKFYEKTFFADTVEKYYSQILGKIINKGNSWLRKEDIDEIINPQEKELFARLIAIQYLRLPNIREKYSDLRKKGIDFTSDLIKSHLSFENPKQKEEIESFQAEYDKSFDPILHSELYADEELLIGITKHILNKHWIYYVAENKDFYTSDNPIIIKPHIPNQRRFYEGFGMDGSEIIFPIGSSILLTMWDSIYFDKMGEISDSFNEITDKQKREYNLYQYMYSNKQTYSLNNDFKLIKLLISLNNGNEYFSEKSKILVNGK